MAQANRDWKQTISRLFDLIKRSFAPYWRTISRFLLLDLIKGLIVTFKYQAPKNCYTEQYPKVRPKVGERFRGAPRLNLDPETSESLCIACNLCAVACPENLITVVETVKEFSDHEGKTKKKRVLADYIYDTSRCMFCGHCQDVCPTYAIELTQDFELAMYRRKDFVWSWEMLEQGVEQPIYSR